MQLGPGPVDGTHTREKLSNTIHNFSRGNYRFQEGVRIRQSMIKKMPSKISVPAVGVSK